jgi:ATP-dependent Lhr-like helicase
VGDLSDAEIAARCAGDPEPWLAGLEAARRAVRVTIAGEPRWIAVEDAGLVRDALGATLPPGLPEAFLAPVPRALEQLVLRFARCHGPFTTAALASRSGLPAQQLEPVLEALAARERLQSGELDPRGSEREWCDPEVLRRLRQRTLAQLRREIEAVDAATFARFLAQWHGVGAPGPSAARLRAALETLEGLPLSFAELERMILPARVPGYDGRMLDELGAAGEIVWVGRGAQGERDLRVALYRRERVSPLHERAPVPEDLAPLPRAVLQQLERRGACFLPELAAAAGGASLSALLDALWDLARLGLVTNDTFAALRVLGARHEVAAAASRRRRSAAQVAAGRWAPVAQLAFEEADPTRRPHARALALLDRFGVVSRDALAIEGISGGFAGLYAVYRQMEELGKLRRGHFVESLKGAQFARAGTVDRLRAARDAGAARAWLLAATDPANPYGALLPWPAARVETAALRRVAGACVAMVDGAPALYLERGGRLFSFPAAEPAAEAEGMRLAAAVLPRLFAWRRRRSLRIAEIDGVPAARSPFFSAFAHAGFRADYKGIALDRSDARAPS